MVRCPRFFAAKQSGLLSLSFAKQCGPQLPSTDIDENRLRNSSRIPKSVVLRVLLDVVQEEVHAVEEVDLAGARVAIQEE